MEKIIHPFLHLVTDASNTNHDLIKWMALVGFVFGMIFQAWDVFHNNAFNLFNYGTGLGVLFGAVAGAVRLKLPTEAPTEPCIEEKPNEVVE